MSVVRADEVPAEAAAAPSSAPEPSSKAGTPGLDLAELFDAHAPFLVRAITRMVGTRDRAEDVVQRAFLIAHRKGLPDVDPDRARAWLYRVAMNELRHERRSLARSLRLALELGRQPTGTGPEPGEQLEASATASRVRAIVAELPPAQREVFVLYELEEMTGTQIAEMVGISENTIWSRLRLARARFKKLWLEAKGLEP